MVMSADEVGPLLNRFAADVSRVVPLVAVWAHGSLALGDFQPGRSDLDLVALVSTTISDTQRQHLQRTHEGLIRCRSRTSCTARTWSDPSWPMSVKLT
jgi:hypothetical protein